MSPRTLIRLLPAMFGALALALAVCAAGAGADSGVLGEGATSTQTSTAPSTTTTQTAGAPTATSTSGAQGEGQTTTTVPAAPTGEPGGEPNGEPAGEPAPQAPQVQTQSAQAPSTTDVPRTPPTHHRHNRSTPGPTTTGGSSPTRPGAHGGASPFGLTPPLPSALGSPISGIPDFFIASFRIPPFLLPIYQAAGSAYGIPWQVLAAINEVETDYGRDLAISSAGAEGWMQFLPSSWFAYGVDANHDGFKDPYNPADAIFAASRYLKAAGGEHDIRGAIFSYNHSQSYVSSVMLRAQLLGGTPPDLLGAITGLTEARFPVHAPSHFSDGFPTAPASASGSAKTLVGTTIYTEQGAPAIAVQDGVIAAIGDSPSLGHYVSLRDAYGNTYTYAQLGSVSALYPVLKPHDHSAPSLRIAGPDSAGDPAPEGPASAGVQSRSPVSEAALSSGLALGAAAGLGSTSPVPTSPTPPAPAPPAPPSPETPHVFRAGPNDVYLHPLRVGVQVIAGTVLGHVETDAGAPPGVDPAASDSQQAHMLFQVRPAGDGAPLIDPKPILDGWVRLESSSVFRAKGENPFLATSPTIGQVLLESKEQLQQQVLHDPGIDLYPCGRQDIQSGQIDRRVLATLEFLSVSGLKPAVSALKCGHSEYTSSGNISEHSTGDAVDISEINGVPIAGHQGSGSITDTTIRKLLTLQGAMKPHQIISLMSYPGSDNTLSMPDHYNHIHVGFRPPFAGAARIAGAFSSTLTPDQWIKLISRLGEIPDPAVTGGHSTAAIPDRPGAATDSSAGTGAAQTQAGAGAAPIPSGKAGDVNH